MSRTHSVVVIKPLSVGRGDGIMILNEILDNCDVRLRKIRQWCICDTSWRALGHLSQHAFDYTTEEENTRHHKPALICIFEGEDQYRSVTDRIVEYCGPEDRQLWKRWHLRYRYSSYRKSGAAMSASDTVVHVVPDKHVILGAQMLFTDINESLFSQ